MRKIRNNSKKINIKIIVLIILSIFLFTISIGYSYLKQSLNITGKSTIVQQSTGAYEKGNSTYNVEIVDSWGGGTSSYVYQIRINIVNMDGDISLWKIAFDVPSTYDDTNTNTWTASQRIYEDGRVTLIAQDRNGYIANGTECSIEFQIACTEEESVLIRNVTLNNLLMSYE